MNKIRIKIIFIIRGTLLLAKIILTMLIIHKNLTMGLKHKVKFL
jgi:hypothetical protein